MNVTWIWTGVVIYIVFALYIAYLSRHDKQGTMVGYFLGNRQMGGFVSALSYSATTYSAFMLIGLAGLTYSGGVGALGFELIYLCGISLVVVFGPRFWLVGKKFGYVTPSEMLGHRYANRGVAVAAALCSLIFLIPYAAVQLAGVGYLMAGMSDGAISFTTGTILAAVLAIVFSIVAGLNSVAWTDSLQAIVMFITATVAAIFVIHGLGGLGTFFSTLQSEHSGALSVPGTGFFNFNVFLGLTLPWFFFCLSNPQVSQRLFTPKSLKSLRHMLLGFMVFGLIYTLVSVIWGFAAVIKLPDLPTGDLATPKLLSSGLIPPALGIVVMIGIIAAAISTIDSIMLTLSSMFTRDVYAVVNKNAGDKQQLLVGKIVLPVIAILAYLFAHLNLSLIAVLSVSASAGLLVIVPPLVGAFFWRRGTAAGALAAIIIGGIAVFWLQFSGLRPLGQASGIWGLIISVLAFVLVSLVTTAPSARANEFINYLKVNLKKHSAV